MPKIRSKKEILEDLEDLIEQLKLERQKLKGTVNVSVQPLEGVKLGATLGILEALIDIRDILNDRMPKNVEIAATVEGKINKEVVDGIIESIGKGGEG